MTTQFDYIDVMMMEDNRGELESEKRWTRVKKWKVRCDVKLNNKSVVFHFYLSSFKPLGLLYYCFHTYFQKRVCAYLKSPFRRGSCNSAGFICPSKYGVQTRSVMPITKHERQYMSFSVSRVFCLGLCCLIMTSWFFVHCACACPCSYVHVFMHTSDSSSILGPSRRN